MTFIFRSFSFMALAFICWIAPFESQATLVGLVTDAAPEVSGDTTICVDSLITLTATTNSGVIIWESPLGTSLGLGNAITTSFNQNTTVYVYSFSNGVNSDTAEIKITTVACLVKVDAPIPSSDTSVCKDSVFTLSATANTGDIYWLDSLGQLIGSGNTLTTSLTSSAMIYLYAEYLIQTSDTVGVWVFAKECMGIDFPEETPPGELIWPTVFTPNNDGINDYFELNIPHTSCLKGSIYNRWGDMVYHVKEYGFSWNGYMEKQGEIAPNGTYYFILSYCEGEKEIIVKGSFSLLR